MATLYWTVIGTMFLAAWAIIAYTICNELRGNDE